MSRVVTDPRTSANLEIELKRLLVGKNAANRLIQALGRGPEAEKRQVNHIFDTDGLRLSKSKYAARLRLEDGQAFLTVKGPNHSVGASTDSKVEAEVALDSKLASRIINGDLDPITVLREHLPDQAYAQLWRGVDEVRGGRPLKRLGQFENVRRTVPIVLPSGTTLRIEFDHTDFPNGRSDDEVEIELPNDAVANEVEAWLDATAQAAGVRTAAATPKTVRFLATLPDEGK